MAKAYDVVVVGSGVNGMVAASLCRDRGLDVLLLEAQDCLGGGVRSKELTLPGFAHDVCSAVHPFARSSPVLVEMGLERYGLEWVDPEVPLAHPLLGQPAVLLHRELEATAASIGGTGGRFYGQLMGALASDWPHLRDLLLGPPLRPPHLSLLPRLARFGLLALSSAQFLGGFLGNRGGALWAGLAAHSLLPMEALSSSAVACVLGVNAHLVGWPLPVGGAGAIARAMECRLREQGVEIGLSRRVQSLNELPRHRALILDLSAKPVLRLLGPLLPPGRRLALSRYRLGPGVFKLDYALSGPMPWSDPEVARAGTIHLGGSLRDIARSEAAVWAGGLAPHPFLLAVQPTLFDPSRAPAGQHTFWVYLHVPNGWVGDASELIESELERYAPGFRDLVLGRHLMSVADFEGDNPNYVGGDILGGANTLDQIVARPFLSSDPYYLGGKTFCCSASVPPGGGIHGMGGYHAVQSVFRRLFS
jgi:phytoene dehydrogenase-like protein